MKKALLAGLLLVGAAFALAGTTLNNFASETWTGTPATQSATGGYIYGINITAEQQTYRWVGFWGNLTGKIVLQDSAENEFYSWNAQVAGSVIYARASSTEPDVANLAAGSASTADTDYGYDATVSDSITNTYTGTADLTTPSRETTVTSVPVVTLTYGSNTWTNYLLADGQDTGTIGAHIWAVVATAAQTGYNNQLANYHLLVPENEEIGDGAGTATTYYFWVDLK